MGCRQGKDAADPLLLEELEGCGSGGSTLLSPQGLSVGRGTSLKEIQNVMNRRTGNGWEAAKIKDVTLPESFLKTNFAGFCTRGKNSHKNIRTSVSMYLSMYVCMYVCRYISIYLFTIYPSFPHVKGQKKDDPRGHLLSRIFGECEEKAIAFAQQGYIYTQLLETSSVIIKISFIYPVRLGLLQSGCRDKDLSIGFLLRGNPRNQRGTRESGEQGEPVL